jgi:hypothetical protein
MEPPTGSSLPIAAQSISISTHRTDSFFYPNKKTHRYQKQTETKAKARAEPLESKGAQSGPSLLQDSAKTTRSNSLALRAFWVPVDFLFSFIDCLIQKI